MINLPTRVFDPFRNMTVGFDDIFDQLSSLSQYEIPNYPPYNIKKVGKDKYQLDMALAGFSKDDVKVEVKGVESKQCLDITKSIEDSLGTVLNREFKPEYYQSVKDVTLQHNKNES